MRDVVSWEWDAEEQAEWYGFFVEAEVWGGEGEECGFDAGDIEMEVAVPGYGEEQGQGVVGFEEYDGESA